MRISDWSSDVCSSDLFPPDAKVAAFFRWGRRRIWLVITYFPATITTFSIIRCSGRTSEPMRNGDSTRTRSEEHTSELQSLMRISYAVFCLKKKKKQNDKSKHKTIRRVERNNK